MLKFKRNFRRQRVKVNVRFWSHCFIVNNSNLFLLQPTNAQLILIVYLLVVIKTIIKMHITLIKITLICVFAGVGWSTMSSLVQWIVWPKSALARPQSAGKPCWGSWAQNCVRTVRVKEQTSPSCTTVSVGSAYCGSTPALVSITTLYHMLTW